MKLPMILISILLLAACSKEEISDPSLDFLDIPLSDGLWKTSSCDYFGSGTYTNQAIVFASSGYTASLFVYSDSTCSTKVMDIVEKGTFVIGGKVSGSSAKVMDRTLSAALITPQSIAAATNMNSQNYCGINSWATGVSKSVSGMNCGGAANVPQAGSMSYDIYYISPFDLSGIPGYPGTATQRGDLNFGYNDATYDGSSPERRPTSLSSRTYRLQK